MGQPWRALLDITAVAGLALWWWPAGVLVQLWWALAAARDREGENHPFRRKKTLQPPLPPGPP